MQDFGTSKIKKNTLQPKSLNEHRLMWLWLVVKQLYYLSAWLMMRMLSLVRSFLQMELTEHNPSIVSSSVIGEE